jgi:hypothetical protein
MNETETFFEGKITEKVTILGCCLKQIVIAFVQWLVGVTTLSIASFSIMTFKMTLSIKGLYVTLGIKGLNVTLSISDISDTQHK